MTAVHSTYPLTWRGLAFGLLAGGIAAVMLDFPIAGLSVLVLCTAVGLTWRRDEVPIFPFVLFYQWVAVSIGMFWERWVGPVPDPYVPGDVERAIVFGLLGLLLLAIGMRLGAGGAGPGEGDVGDVDRQGVSRLFWIVMAAFAVDYLYILNPKQYFGADVIIERVLAFRYVLLLGLWGLVLAGKDRRIYLVASFIWVFVPSFGAYYSDFKLPVFLLLLTYATRWEPWATRWWRRGAAQSVLLAPVVVLVLFAAVLWQAGAKRETRAAYDRGQVGTSGTERIELFAESAQGTLPAVLNDFQSAVADLVARLSYVTFFSRVLDHVPAVEPHANGELLRMAFVNGMVPRFLYPEKPALPSDSVYTRRFAGVWVAENQEVQTSISIGYMAEFYADWGTTGMFVSVLGYGLWMGVLHRGIRRFIRSPVLLPGTLVAVMLVCMTFEHQFVKGFGALNIGFAVTVSLAYLVTPALRRILRPDPKRRPRPDHWTAPAVHAPTGET